MAQQAVFAVLERGGSIAVDEAVYLLGVSEKLESAKKQLLLMQAFLMDLDEKMLKGNFMARHLASEVREIAYDVEDIIDTANILMRRNGPKTSVRGAMSKYACFPIYLTRLHKLGSRIDSTEERMKKLFGDFEKFNIAANAIAEEPRRYITEDDDIRHRRLVHPNSGDQVGVIGFDEQIKQIEYDLLDTKNRHLTVVSIVGPGGAGKSTMAKKVYSLPAVKGHFKVHCWLTVSQRAVATHDFLKEVVKMVVPSHLMKVMVLRVMGDVKVKKVDNARKMMTEKEEKKIWEDQKAKELEEAKELDKLEEHEVKKLLHEFALSQRYLIVLDDIWSKDAWDAIKHAFPNQKNGSRIILTTRNVDVAKLPGARKKIYRPKLLNEDESTQLLLTTALPEYILDGGQNLDELKELGKELAIKCGGLPLALIVLGGYLSRNLDVGEWKRLLTNSMDWQDLITSDRVIGAILDLSYYDMPSHLRSCFMYTTAFPEDSPIDVRVLAMLWIAEGFIPLVRGQTREKVALKYVAELVQRCMIQAEGWTNSGMIKVVKVHDILREWGFGRAQREGFMKDCHSAEDIEVAYSGEEMMKAYRVVLHSSLSLERGVGTTTRKLRTLLDFNNHTSVQVPKSFQGLRVLHLNCSGEVSLPKDIHQMRYLRYLGLGGNCSYDLPSNIGGLLSLETLYCTASIDHIPASLWRNRTLRQVHIPYARSLSSPQIGSQSSKVLVILVDCGSSTHMDDAKRIVEKTRRQVLRNKNLDLSFCLGVEYGKYGMEVIGRCNTGVQFPIDLLNFDETHDYWELKICCANLLSNDHKILELGRIKNLKVLEIGEQSYTGKVMVFTSGSFMTLERLVLYDLAVEKWKIECGSMICLRVLTLCKCPKLVHLPEELLRLPKLRSLALIAMPLGCYQKGEVPQGVKISESDDEKVFQHLPIWR